jgi:RNA polymerase sigma-70 factor (ECF subfamily)
VAVRADDVDLVRDRSLVELCQAGDERAFADLYTRYYARLLRFCTRRVGNVHEAEEITQEAFARAFSAMPRFAGERRFYPWLTVIASRLCIDSHRRVARTEPTAEVDPGGTEGGQQQIVDNVDLAYLSEAMHRLGPRHREVLTLRESHGWSYQQIADHYEVTLGTVEALLFRARKALRREFIALSGEESRLAAIPVVGVALRAAYSLKARFSDLSSAALPLAAAGAASVAAVAGGIALNNNSNHADRPAPAPQVARVVHSPAVVSSAIAPSTNIADLIAPATQQTETPPSTLPTQATVILGDAAAGRAQTANDPSGLKLGGMTISTDLADMVSLLNGSTE